MPIYAYKCDSCGFTKDALQKMSDAPLTVCPQCNQPTFTKQVTAAGFQLKGSGWYVTDFRGGNNATKAAADTGDSSAPKGEASAAPGKTDGSTATDAAASPTAPVSPAPSPAAAPTSPAPAPAAKKTES